MPQNFVDKVGPVVSAAWLNGVDGTCNVALGGAQTVAQAQSVLGIVLGPPVFFYPQTLAESAAGVTPTNTTYASPGIESGNLLRYGGTAPATMHDVVFFDASQTQGLIGNGVLVATNLWFSNGTASSRPAEFANAFEYNATGGGTLNDPSHFGVALYSAAHITGGSRGVWAFNCVANVDVATRQNACYAIEADVNNNSSSDCNIGIVVSDQIVGVLASSGGTHKPLAAFKSFATAETARWQIGSYISNWSSFGIQIVQDPVGVPLGALTPVTGPCIVMQGSSAGAAGLNPILRILDSTAALRLQILQNGQLQLPNNLGLDFLDSTGTPQTALFVSPANNTYLACSPTGPGNGYLTDQSLGVKFAWNSTGLAYYGKAPIAQPTTGVGSAAFAQVDLVNVVSAESTFDGYTLSQVVRAFRNLGLLA